MPDFKTHPTIRADRVLHSLNNEVPSPRMVQFISEVDLSAIDRLRSRHEGHKPSYTACIAKAIGLAIREYPYANRRWFWWGPLRRLLEFEGIHIAIAVERHMSERTAAPEILYHVDKLPLKDIQARLKEWSESDPKETATFGTLLRLLRYLPVFAVQLLCALPASFQGSGSNTAEAPQSSLRPQSTASI